MRRAKGRGTYHGWGSASADWRGGGGARRGAVVSKIKRAVTGEIQQGWGEARGVSGGGARRRAGPAVMSLVERAVIGGMPLWAGQGARIGGRWRAAGGGAAASGEVSGVLLPWTSWRLRGNSLGVHAWRRVKRHLSREV